jgi:nucleoside-diphosphate-sugar epimerase
VCDLNILVTGGAGYVGSTLVSALLQHGHRVRVLDSLMWGGRSLLGVWADPGFEFVRGDVRDGELVKDALAGIDAVVHLAAIVGDPACAKKPKLAEEVNLQASLSLIDTAREAGVSRFAFASTCSNYGRMADPTSYVDERSELRPISLYAETKVAVEKALLAANDPPRFCATALRFATVFGVSPRMRFDLTVNEFTMNAVVDKRLVVFGETFWRPYIHVCDLARGVRAVLEAPAELVAGEAFNVGATPQNHQKQQLVEMIRPYAPDAAYEFVQKDEDPRDYRVSFEKIRSTLGFKCSNTVESGVAEIAELAKSGVIINYNSPEYRNTP